MPATQQLRQQVADLARDYRAGRVDFRTFLTRLPRAADDADDEQIGELMTLIEHQPAVGGLLGVRRAEHEAHVARIDALIEELAGGRQ